MYGDSLIIHWGIKGMHWGIRRYRNEDGTLTEAGKRRYYKQSELKSLSDEELAQAVKRIDMEKKYLDAVKQVTANDDKNADNGKGKDKEKKHTARQVVADILSDSAKKLASSAVSRYVDDKAREANEKYENEKRKRTSPMSEWWKEDTYEKARAGTLTNEELDKRSKIIEKWRKIEGGGKK